MGTSTPVPALPPYTCPLYHIPGCATFLFLLPSGGWILYFSSVILYVYFHAATHFHVVFLCALWPAFCLSVVVVSFSAFVASRLPTNTKGYSLLLCYSVWSLRGMYLPSSTLSKFWTSTLPLYLYITTCSAFFGGCAFSADTLPATHISCLPGTCCFLPPSLYPEPMLLMC